MIIEFITEVVGSITPTSSVDCACLHPTASFMSLIIPLQAPYIQKPTLCPNVCPKVQGSIVIVGGGQ